VARPRRPPPRTPTNYASQAQFKKSVKKKLLEWVRQAPEKYGPATPPPGSAWAPAPGVRVEWFDVPKRELTRYRRGTPDDTAEYIRENWPLEGDARLVTLGPYVWRVVDVTAERGRRCATLWSEYAIGMGQYHSRFEAVTWATSELRSYLNGPFFDDLPKAVRDRVAPTRVVTLDNPLWEIEGGPDCPDDRVFLPAMEDLTGPWEGKAEADIKAAPEEERPDHVARLPQGADLRERYGDLWGPKTRPVGGGDAVWWWLRSPGQHRNTAAVVSPSGAVDAEGSMSATLSAVCAPL